ncbi:hypothetical protein Pmani_023456 [Petrolisthes manimaculis]|uniref:Uncharacterized protein n=1 Tax=Petrolisthes manimaculis TaxID=1843537 RepID=A0AAE1U075_9EUCA|nr:hypothetical protein Pmani_023456 [Petrolisthes manimaculis]
MHTPVLHSLTHPPNTTTLIFTNMSPNLHASSHRCLNTLPHTAQHYIHISILHATNRITSLHSCNRVSTTNASVMVHVIAAHLARGRTLTFANPPVGNRETIKAVTRTRPESHHHTS